MECCLNFFMNFLNIEKNKILRFFFSKFHGFMLFPTLKKNLCKKKIRGGGGGVFRKTILSHFTFYAIFNIKKIILKSAPSLTG